MVAAACPRFFRSRITTVRIHPMTRTDAKQVSLGTRTEIDKMGLFLPRDMPSITIFSCLEATMYDKFAMMTYTTTIPAIEKGDQQ